MKLIVCNFCNDKLQLGKNFKGVNVKLDISDSQIEFNSCKKRVCIEKLEVQIIRCLIQINLNERIMARIVLSEYSIIAVEELINQLKGEGFDEQIIKTAIGELLNLNKISKPKNGFLKAT